MKSRPRALQAVLLLSASTGLLMFSATAASASLPAARSGAAAAAGTFVKAYSAVVGKTQLSLDPADVQATSDGGSIALSQTETSKGGVDWLVKLSSTGATQWQEELGCSAGSSEADGVSVQQTADGGYIAAGGTSYCGSGGPNCGQQCGLVEKLTSTGAVSWAREYAESPAAGADGMAFNRIRQTTDGGYIVAGSITESNGYSGALIVKLGSTGTVQWQQDLGPVGTTEAVFNSVQQTSDGGYVAAGSYYVDNNSIADPQVLVAKFTSTGSLTWQQGFATYSGGAPTSTSQITSVIQTSDGGYAVAGGWSNSTFNGDNGARGALLLKLSSTGSLQWQQAYSGGLYCPDGDCSVIGAFSYSLHQTSDGGYVLAGDADIEQPEVTIEPWLAKVNASGGLLWQTQYYRVYTKTGLPLNEDFSGSAITSTGGFLAAGPTEDYSTGNEELYLVNTDSSGNAGSCGDQHAATVLTAISPELAATTPALPFQTPTTVTSSLTITSTATSVSTTTDC